MSKGWSGCGLCMALIRGGHMLPDAEKHSFVVGLAMKEEEMGEH